MKPRTGFPGLAWATHANFRLLLKTIAWAFENALVALGTVLAAPFLYRGFDLASTLATIKNFVDHLIWRGDWDVLIGGLWWALLGLFVIVCVFRLPAFRAMRIAERRRAA